MRRMMMASLVASVLALGLAACSASDSEPATEASAEATTWPGVPEEQAAQVRAAGKVIDPASFAIFAPLVPPPPYDDVTMATEVAYGTDPQQRLDLYTLNAAPAGEKRPVLVFVHGGGFTGGSKQGDYYPQNTTAWAARNGMVGVNIDYRLAPAAQWPAARDDIAAALTWVRANIAQYGGDPDRIILWGHSAGASHVADYVQHTELQGPEAAAVKGALLLSPAYQPAVGAEPHPYYAADADLQTSAPAIRRLGASRIPLMLAWAQYDPDMFNVFAREVESQLCAEGTQLNCPQLLYLRNHNHMTEGASIGSVDESLSGPFLQWMRGL